MTDRAAYDYRAFMIQVSDSLAQKDIESIVYLHELPLSLAKESPLTVLVQLEMGGITSANKPDDLAKLLKEIGRHDLAKKVKDFAKKQRKGRPTLTPLQRLDQSAVNLNASLKLTLIQCKILLEQVENVKEEAEEAGFKRVEEVVAEAHTLISERLQTKLQYASKLLLQESTVYATQCSRDNERDSPPSSPNSSLDSSLELEAQSSAEPVLPMQPPIASQPVPLQHVNRQPVRYVRESEVKAAVGNLRSQSLPRSKGNTTKLNQAAGPSAKQPMVPPSRLPSSSKETATTGQLTSTVGSARQVHAVLPRLEQGRDEGTAPMTQMVTGKPNSQKPTPPPKPKNKLKKATAQVEINQPDEECVYDDVNTYSSTGDSGFGDSKEFLKVPLHGHYEPPQVFNTQVETPLTQSHSYATLNASTVNTGYYKSLRRDGIQEVQYAPQVVPPAVTASNPNTHYMNITKGKK